MKAKHTYNHDFAASILMLLFTAVLCLPVLADDFGGQTTGTGENTPQPEDTNPDPETDPESSDDKAGDNKPPPSDQPAGANCDSCCTSCPCDDDGTGGDPVSLFDGRLSQSHTDMRVNGLFPITVTRRYDSRSYYDSPLGYGWSLSHDRSLYEFPDGSVTIRYACGSRDRFVFTGGAYVTPAGGRQGDLVENPDGSFVYTRQYGTKEYYDAEGRLTAVQNKYGHRHEYTYDPAGKLPLTGTSPYSIDPAAPMTVGYFFRLTRIDERAADGILTGNYVTFSYNATTGRLVSVTSSDGRTVSYVHDVTGGLTKGNLVQVNGLEGIVTTYQYQDANDAHNLTSVQEEAGATPWLTSYDTNDQVLQQTHGNDNFSFDYVVPLTEATITHTIRDEDGLNPYDVVTTYFFDTNGDVSRTRDALGHEIEYLRDAQGNMTTKNFFENKGTVAVPDLVLQRTIIYGYDALSRQTTESVTLDSGETITKSWAYDNGWLESEQVVSSADPGKIFRTEYTFYRDGQNIPTNIQSIKRRKDDGSFQVTSFSYDSKNRLSETILPDGQKIINLYEGGSLYTTKRYYEIGVAESPFMRMRYAYDTQGNRNQEWDANDNLTQYTYDDLGRLTNVTNALGEETIYTYTGTRLAQSEVGHTVAEGEGQVTKRNYTPEGWLSSMQRKKDDGTWLASFTYTYDSRGKTLTSTDAENRTMQYNYDLLGRLVTITDPKLKATSYGYDMYGNPVSVIDARLNEAKYVYDDLDRLIQIEQLGISPSVVTRYTYNAVGNRTSVTDPENHTTSYTYDTLSHNTAVTQPLGQAVQYIYDARDRLDYKINARGHKIAYEYEPWGAVKAIRYYSTTSATTPDKTVTYTYYPIGRVQNVTDGNLPGFSYQYSYDALNRVDMQVISGLGGVDKRLDNDYDRYGNRSALVLTEWSGSLWVEQYHYQYQYNKLNLLASADLIEPQPFTFDYFATGEIRQIIHPNGVITDFLYEPNGPVQQIKVSGVSGIIEQFDYTYDDVWNVDTQTTQAGVHDYTYDGVNRLTQALHPAAIALPVQEDFAYDLVGNREDSADPELYDYDVNNRILKSPGLTYSFDDDGNQIGRSDGAAFEFDKNNRLVRFTKGGTDVTYTYDPDGRRIRKTVDGVTTYYLWGDSLLLAEYSSTGAQVRRYAYLPDWFVPVQMADANGVYSLHSDHLQTPRLLTNVSQSKVWNADYEAYGTGIIDENPDGDGLSVSLNLRFPGQYYDIETGLHYNYHRDYDPSAGRYLEQDPIGFEGGINLYSYADSNPVNAFDPAGLRFCQVCKWVKIGAQIVFVCYQITCPPIVVPPPLKPPPIEQPVEPPPAPPPPPPPLPGPGLPGCPIIPGLG